MAEKPMIYMRDASSVERAKRKREGRSVDMKGEMVVIRSSKAQHPFASLPSAGDLLHTHSVQNNI